MLSLSVSCVFRVNRVFLDFQDLKSIVPGSLYQFKILLPPSPSRNLNIILKNTSPLLDTHFPDFPSILTYKMDRISYKAGTQDVFQK